jgi:hypothetical protein
MLTFSHPSFRYEQSSEIGPVASRERIPVGVRSVQVHCPVCPRAWTARDSDGSTVLTLTGLIVTCPGCETTGEYSPPGR